MFYIRYRHAQLFVSFSIEPTKDMLDAVMADTRFNIYKGCDPYDGYMETKEMLALTKDVIDWSSYLNACHSHKG